MKSFKIFLLKRKLKRTYIEIKNMDTYGMGNNLFNHATGGRLNKAKAEFNAILGELEKIDPSAPKNRMIID